MLIILLTFPKKNLRNGALKRLYRRIFSCSLKQYYYVIKY